jgi:hypothetical protein
MGGPQCELAIPELVDMSATCISLVNAVVRTESACSLRSDAAVTVRHDHWLRQPQAEPPLSVRGGRRPAEDQRQREKDRAVSL